MESQYREEEKDLSACETLIMKAIWDKGEDISIQELLETLKVKYGKDYKRTTLVTFILNLAAKGFARQYRNGKYAYVHAIKSEEEYREKLLTEQMDFWYEGDSSELVSALCKTGKMTTQDIEKIRGLLDELDD